MPRYRFEGWAESVLSGLAHGVNARLHRKGHDQPEGSTVVVQPGDEVSTDEPYPHAHMVNLATGKSDVPETAPPAEDAAPATAPPKKRAPRKAPAKKAAPAPAAAPAAAAANPTAAKE